LVLVVLQYVFVSRYYLKGVMILIWRMVNWNSENLHRCRFLLYLALFIIITFSLWIGMNLLRYHSGM
jgi:hypothetical protein